MEMLQKVRYHWHSYVARGGFNTPREIVGTLEKGGLKHWSMFLQIARTYLQEYPRNRYLIEGFVPKGIMKLLTGE